MKYTKVTRQGISQCVTFINGHQCYYIEENSELVIGEKYNNKKLYTVLSYLGVFTFRTCCKILICLVCIVATFKLSCV